VLVPEPSVVDREAKLLDAPVELRGGRDTLVRFRVCIGHVEHVRAVVRLVDRESVRQPEAVLPLSDGPLPPQRLPEGAQRLEGRQRKDLHAPVVALHDNHEVVDDGHAVGAIKLAQIASGLPHAADGVAGGCVVHPNHVALLRRREQPVLPLRPVPDGRGVHVVPGVARGVEHFIDGRGVGHLGRGRGDGEEAEHEQTDATDPSAVRTGEGRYRHGGRSNNLTGQYALHRSSTPHRRL
jgi:hypothetical protein